MKIRRDDTVKVISGKDRGKTGKVLRVDPVKGRVIVEGVNVQKRHQRPTGLGGGQQQAGVIEVEGPVHVSNVQLLDPKSGNPTRIGLTRNADGRRVRVAKKSGQELD
ncbi:MAG: 50S ribosomal protein L24 [Thermoleophilaceae bacterium]